MDSVSQIADHATPVAPNLYPALELYLKPIRQFMSEQVTEVCINAPREIWTETHTGWNRHSADVLDYAQLMLLAKQCATSTGQDINNASPLLSAQLPTGERVQVVIPAATSSGHVSFTIRKPTAHAFTMDDYERQGFFENVSIVGAQLQAHEVQLLAHLKAGEFRQFLETAVRSKQTIVVSGATGSGKTSFMKMLVNMIPADERLITIEDTPELTIQNQPNHVRLFYSKGTTGASKVSSRDLIESSMRMKPDRLLLAEIRDAAAYYFIGAANTGHPGSITSVHANSEVDAFARIEMLMREAEPARNMADTVIQKIVRTTVDVVIHIGKVQGKRRITGIYYDPARKYSLVG